MFEDVNEPIIMKDDSFKRCVIVLSFPIKNYREEELRVLRGIGFDKSEKYNTDKKIFEINTHNNCLYYNGSVVFYGNTPFLEFHLWYPSCKSLGYDVLEENLKFIKEIIYHPYLENGAFPSSRVNDIINIIKNDIVINKKSAGWYYDYKNDTLIDEDNFLVDEYISNPSLLDEVTASGVYNLYESIIKETPIVLLLGDVDVSSSMRLIKEILFDNEEKRVTFEKDYNHFVRNIPSEVSVYKEKTSFKTSAIYYNYKVKDMKNDKDKFLVSLVRLLLDSNKSKILFHKLREENDFVYRCGAYCYSNLGMITLWAFTDKENLEKVSECYNDVMDEISDVKYIEEKLPLIEKKFKLEEELIKEDIKELLLTKVDRYIGYKNKSDYEYIKEVSADLVSEFIKKRMVLTDVYVGVGGNNE